MDTVRRMEAVRVTCQAEVTYLMMDMMRSMTETLRRWEEDTEVKLIIVVGEGERAFCSGGDVKSIAAARGQPLQQGRPSWDKKENAGEEGPNSVQ